MQNRYLERVHAEYGVPFTDSVAMAMQDMRAQILKETGLADVPIKVWRVGELGNPHPEDVTLEATVPE